MDSIYEKFDEKKEIIIIRIVFKKKMSLILKNMIKPQPIS
jgi:hypothetical protein